MTDFSCVITGGGETEGAGGADALRASVASVLGQSLQGCEALVVLASGAGAATRTAARALADSAPGRVRLVHADPAARTTGALRNAGLDAATGRYVLVLTPASASTATPAATSGRRANAAAPTWSPDGGAGPPTRAARNRNRPGRTSCSPAPVPSPGSPRRPDSWSGTPW